MHRKKGFTILELMIVIAVIAILVGIALPRFKGMKDEGKIAKAKGELRTLQTAIESYNMHIGSYPSSLASLTTATPNLVGATLPTDPFTTSSNYGYVTDGDYFVVYSVGPGGNGSASIDDEGEVTETNGTSCIYSTNGSPVDTQP